MRHVCLEEGPVVRADIDRERIPREARHLDKLWRERLEMTSRGRRRATYEREILVDDPWIDDVAELREAARGAVVKLHRIKRLGLVELGLREDQVPDRLRTDVEAGYRHASANLAFDGFRFLRPAARR